MQLEDYIEKILENQEEIQKELGTEDKTRKGGSSKEVMLPHPPDQMLRELESDRDDS